MSKILCPNEPIPANPEEIQEFGVTSLGLDNRKLDVLNIAHLLPELLDIGIGNYHACIMTATTNLGMTRKKCLSRQRR